jgi:hypothetical protein
VAYDGFEAGGRFVGSIEDGDDDDGSTDDVIILRRTLDRLEWGCHEAPWRESSEVATERVRALSETPWFLSDVTLIVDRFRNTTCRKLPATDRNFGENDALEDVLPNIRV